MKLSVAVPFLCVVAALGATSRAHGMFVQADTAVASSQFTQGFDGRAINTINGSGLPAGFGPGDTHSVYVSGNHWTTAGGPATQEFITWGFSTPQSLHTIHIWNHRSTTPPAASPTYDVTLFDLTLLDSANQTLLSLTDVAMLPNVAVAQSYSFGGAIDGISAIRFNIRATEGSTTFTGLGEVLFEVPSPATAAIALAFAFGGVRRARGAGRGRA